MSYKTLMTHLTGSDAQEHILRYAAQLADKSDAHLDVICHGVDHMTAGFQYGGIDPLMIQQSLESAMQDSEALEKSARTILEKTMARWGLDRVVNPLGTLGRNVAVHSRFTDLVVLSGPFGPDQTEDAETVLEGALLHADVPVLVVPGTPAPPVTPGIISIGWNESAEALRAVRSALPLLQQAQQVRVTVIDPPRHGSDRSDPGGPLSIFLARHGVNAEIDVIGKSLPRVSDVLLRHAADKGVELIVMGAYGRSRFRETILGGATRDMLEQTELPVLMKH